jgi:hypothetical protein
MGVSPAESEYNILEHSQDVQAASMTTLVKLQCYVLGETENRTEGLYEGFYFEFSLIVGGRRVDRTLRLMS